MHRQVDAVVIGGGPAGALCSLALAQRGWSILLVERGAEGREKTCGHCVNARALRVLARHGLLEQTKAIATGCSTHLIVHSKLSKTAFCSPLGDDGLVVPRSALDQMLREHAARAGAQVIYSATARLKERDDQCAHVEMQHAGDRFQVSCKLVIAADGVGSETARAAGLIDRRAIGRKFGFSFDLQTDCAEALAENAIEMFMADGGYVGAVRQGRHVHVAGLISSRVARPRREPLGYIRELAQHHAKLRTLGFDQITHSQMEGLIAVGPMPWKPRMVANQRIALVGDAAGYVEPFTGEGIGWALLSAQTLKDTLAQYPNGAWNRDTARHYAKAWSEQVGRKQRMCQFLAPALSRSRISAMMFALGRNVKPLTRRLMNCAVSS